MLKRLKSVLAAFLLLFITIPSHALELTEGWVDEKQMNFLVSQALKQQRVLTKLNCRFTHENDPGREDVRFKPFFEQTAEPVAWGWTFDANAPNRVAETQARDAGFKVHSEDYYEITGVTWVRCKIWRR